MFYSGAKAWRCLESVGRSFTMWMFVKTDKTIHESQGVKFRLRRKKFNHVQSKKDSRLAEFQRELCRERLGWWLALLLARLWRKRPWRSTKSTTSRASVSLSVLCSIFLCKSLCWKHRVHPASSTQRVQVFNVSIFITLFTEPVQCAS